MTVRLTDLAIRLIEGKNIGFLSTLSPDGWPHVTPVWVDRDGDYVLVNSSLGRKKVNNVSRDPRVSIAIADSANPYSWVLIRGRVKETTTTGAEEHIHKLAKKYTGTDKFQKGPNEKRVILRIEPLEILPR